MMNLKEAHMHDAALRGGESIQMETLAASASAEAAAAAAGVHGGAVAATLRGIQRDSAQAKQALHENTMQQARAARHERTNVALAAVYNKDISVIPRPSAASALLGLGMNLIDIYDSHQPPGQTLLDRAMR